MIDTSRAIESAKAVAAALDLTVDAVTILQDANRLTLRLLPCDVVARVERGSHGAAPIELDLARRLVAHGAPVGPPDPRAGAGVHAHDGYGITLWTHLEPTRFAASAQEYGRALARLHAGMREIDEPVPGFVDRVDDALRVVEDPPRSPDLPAEDRAFLSRRLRALQRTIGDRAEREQLLHGEPHPGNVLMTAEGPLFIDLETVCRGPVEFDVAHVPAAAAAQYPELDLSLLDDCRELVLAMVAAWRWERDDDFPDGRLVAAELLRALHAGPPWPTLDALDQRS